MLRLYSSLIIFFLCANPGLAAKISAHELGWPNHDERLLIRCSISLDGDIEDGDAQELEKAAAETRSSQQKFLCLDSGGGSLAAGIALGKVLREIGIATYIAPEAQCLSACAVVFMAGSRRIDSDEREPLRVLSTEGRLAVHAPLLVGLSPDENIPGQVALDSYDSAIASIGQMLDMFSADETDVEGGQWFRSSMLVAMLRTPPTEFFEIEQPHHFGRWNIILLEHGTVSPKKLGVEAGVKLGHVDPLSIARACWNVASWNRDIAGRAFRDWLANANDEPDLVVWPTKLSDDGVLWSVGDRFERFGCQLSTDFSGRPLKIFSPWITGIGEMPVSAETIWPAQGLTLHARTYAKNTIAKSGSLRSCRMILGGDFIGDQNCIVQSSVGRRQNSDFVQLTISYLGQSPIKLHLDMMISESLPTRQAFLTVSRKGTEPLFEKQPAEVGITRFSERPFLNIALPSGGAQFFIGEDVFE